MTTPASIHDIFDVRKMRRLVELMKEHDLTEIDIQQGELRIQLRRAGSTAQPGMLVPGVLGGPLGSMPGKTAEPGGETEKEPSSDSGRFTIIRSPMVGTFYAAPDPESPPYVKVGDHVGPETTVCIVEAMKVFNQIPAEVAGKIVAVLAENGASVEFGQPLFKVDTSE